MKLFSFTLCLTACAVSSSLNAQTNPLWTNPLDEQRADPSVHRHTDGYYYLTATVPEEDRIELRRATSLSGLGTAEAKVVWRRPANGPMGGRVWAPEIHFLDGK
jgi:GH43 family beta-xylosidase